jgi:hypothetical protein
MWVSVRVCVCVRVRALVLHLDVHVCDSLVVHVRQELHDAGQDLSCLTLCQTLLRTHTHTYTFLSCKVPVKHTHAHADIRTKRRMQL